MDNREKIKTILSKAEYVEELDSGNKLITGALDIEQVNKLTDQILALFDEEMHDEYIKG